MTCKYSEEEGLKCNKPNLEPNGIKTNNLSIEWISSQFLAQRELGHTVGRRANFGLISPSFGALLVLVKRRKFGFEGFKKSKVWNSPIC